MLGCFLPNLRLEMLCVRGLAMTLNSCQHFYNVNQSAAHTR